MNELKVNLENLTEEERNQLTALLEKSQKPKRVGTWFPDMKELYWVITPHGATQLMYCGDQKDHKLFNIQDPIRAEEEAIKRFEQHKALIAVNRQVRDIIADEYPEYKVNWENHQQQKTFPCYDHESGSVFFWDSSSKYQSNFLFEFAPLNVWEKVDKRLIKKAMGV